eukprot:TRINITY_DN1592_c0_g2_i1.p2 TRINITY_DN1592_c0_g2~~TRINITY_DN1592_c0_g2_i1.p2  ORF type:complete len:163 (+),score=52.86 TRINITY_DN1592_c0_g2_i1:68-490(+)
MCIRDRCKTCIDNLASSCNTCYQGFGLLDIAPNSCIPCGAVIYNDICIEKCPVYYFANSKKVCEQCSDQCDSCETNATYCTKCKNTTLYALEGKCVQSCPKTGYYQNETSKVCAKCPNNCDTCTGSEISQCTLCLSLIHI